MEATKTINSGLMSINKMASGSIQLKINYLETLNFRPGSYIKSPTFTAGGYEWMIFFYPKGKEGDQGVFVSLYVFLRSIAKNVSAIFDFTLLEKEGYTSMTKVKRLSQVFANDTFPSLNFPCGWVQFFKEDEVIENYLIDDYIVIICTVTIISSNSSKPPAESSFISLPSMDLREHFAQLLEDKDMKDVSFEVEGEVIQAHKLVLAARSPVFKSMFYGRSQKNQTDVIRINEIEASVFKILLHFIYTDSLPDDEDACKGVTMTQRLLAAADNYALDRLKLMCEERLCSDFSVENFVSTIVLAEQHNCTRLKAACLYFANDPGNFSKIALTDDYLNLSVNYPCILKDLRKKLSNKSKKT